MSVVERVNPEQAWVSTLAAAVAALVVGALAFPRVVWDRFLWQYFWGPVYADAHNAACAVLEGGSPTLFYDSGACRQAVVAGRVVAEPGYTLVSEAGYAVTLVFMLVGVYYLLRRLEIGSDRGLFFALVPFMFFGGALRVVEDAFDAVPAGVDPLVTYPWNTLIISPVIYFTVFFVTLAALLASVRLASAGFVGGYERPLAAVGTAALAVTVGYLTYLALTREYVAFYPQVAVVVLVGAGVSAGGVWLATERFAPGINEGTGYIGLVILVGHAIDGVANVIAADWLDAIGVPLTYGAKHPINRIIIGVTDSFQPASLDAVIGTSWPFLVVKLAVALLVVAIFDAEIFEESPRYAILLLIAILAVGLGPGTRDMLRATFGI